MRHGNGITLEKKYMVTVVEITVTRSKFPHPTCHLPLRKCDGGTSITREHRWENCMAVYHTKQVFMSNVQRRLDVPITSDGFIECDHK